MGKKPELCSHLQKIVITIKALKKFVIWYEEVQLVLTGSRIVQTRLL